MNNSKYYPLMVTTLGLILLGSGFFGSGPLPIASADNDDSNDDSHDDSNNDKSEKFKKLKEKIKKLIEEHKKKKKCKNQKYGDICDNKKPKIKITSPEKKEKLPSQPFLITGTAFDKISGIKEVKVKINTNGYKQFQLATLTGDGNWEFPVDALEPGKYKITAKAKDFANNSKQVKLKFKVVVDAECEISVVTKNSSGGELTGYWTVFYKDGVRLQTGFSPETFDVSCGEDYEVKVRGFNGVVFDQWGDGNTNDRRTFSINSDTTFTAFLFP